MSNPKKIGEGTYGCVHRPSLKCKDNKIISNYNDKISKIMEDEHAQTEMQEYVGINRIDPDNMYHIKPQECKPDNNAEMKKSILECNLGKEIVKKMDKYKLIALDPRDYSNHSVVLYSKTIKSVLDIFNSICYDFSNQS